MRLECKHTARLSAKKPNTSCLASCFFFFGKRCWLACIVNGDGFPLVHPSHSLARLGTKWRCTRCRKTGPTICRLKAGWGKVCPRLGRALQQTRALFGAVRELWYLGGKTAGMSAVLLMASASGEPTMDHVTRKQLASRPLAFVVKLGGPPPLCPSHMDNKLDISTEPAGVVERRPIGGC